MKTNPSNRQKSWTLRVLLTVLIIAIFATPAASQGDTTQPAPGYEDSQVVVKFINEVIAQRVLDTLSSAFVIDRLASSPVFLIGFCCAPVEPYTEAQKLMAQHGVVYAHPNFVIDSLNSVQGSYPFPDDPGSDNKYHGQPAADALDLDRVHPATTGQGVRIGIIDGGINMDHPLFENMSFGGWDFVDKDNKAFDEPGGLVSGHGTFVAGMLHLVAPGAELVPYRVMDTSGHGNGFALALAIERAVADGCRLINISLILTDRHWPVKDAIEYAESLGVAVVAAAGNYASSDGAYPSVENDPFAVAAINSEYILADFSNYGTYIDICAPGVDLYSPYLDSSYAWWSGTSFAAPCVTGQLALLTEVYPQITIDDFRTIMFENSIDLYEYNPDYTGMLGYGMINTYKAVLAAGIMAIMDASTPTNPAITLSIDPTHLEHTGIVRSSFNIVEWVMVESSNQPVVYYAEVVGNRNSFTTFNQFTDLRWSAGLTGGPAIININPADINKPGVYVDTVKFWIAGAQSPAVLVIELTMVSRSSLLAAESDEFEGSGLSNYPNPFNPSTTICFSLEKATDVELAVFDILGRKVSCLHNGALPAGEQRIVWDGTNDAGQRLSSGVYFYRLTMGDEVETRKMMMIK